MKAETHLALCQTSLIVVFLGKIVDCKMPLTIFVKMYSHHRCLAGSKICLWKDIRGYKLIKPQNYYDIETSQSICSANQLTVFYVVTTLAFNELISFGSNIFSYSAIYFFYTFCSIVPRCFKIW